MSIRIFVDIDANIYFSISLSISPQSKISHVQLLHIYSVISCVLKCIALCCTHLSKWLHNLQNHNFEVCDIPLSKFLIGLTVKTVVSTCK